MGRWAQNKRRGGGGTLTSSGLFQAPVLTANGDPDISWTYGGPAVDNWLVEVSPDGATAWVDQEILPGADRDAHTEVAGFFYRVTGRDALNAQVTNISNVVLQF